jgi:hypothetical protein
MDTNFTKVITYIGDLSELKAQLSQLEKLNADVAHKMGAEFGKAFNVQKMFGDARTSIKRDIEGMSFEKVSQNVLLTTGQVGELTRATTLLGTKVTDVSYSFREFGATATASLTGLAGQSSKLATNFDSVADVNRKFADQLKDVGEVSYIIGRNINKVTDDTAKYGYEAATTNGKIIQLGETHKKLPGDIRDVSRSV